MTAEASAWAVLHAATRLERVDADTLRELAVRFGALLDDRSRDVAALLEMAAAAIEMAEEDLELLQQTVADELAGSGERDAPPATTTPDTNTVH
jgi:hypothetical protein